jgi:hypothetical protein
VVMGGQPAAIGLAVTLGEAHPQVGLLSPPVLRAAGEQTEAMPKAFPFRHRSECRDSPLAAVWLDAINFDLKAGPEGAPSEQGSPAEETILQGRTP